MASYLRSTQDFLYRRRRPFLIVGGLVGGIYMAVSYAATKLSDMQRRMVEERRDRENLRRRFAQNQEDCTFTVLALLPTLGDQLFAYMDVEALTAKLQRSRQVPENEVQSITPAVEFGQHRESEGAAEGASEQIRSSNMEMEGDIRTDHADAVSTQQESRHEPSNASSKHSGQHNSVMEEVWNKLDPGDQHQEREAIVNMPLNGLVANRALPHDASTEVASTGDVSINAAAQQAPVSGLDAVAEPAPLPIPPQARLSPSPQSSPKVSLQEKHTLSDDSEAPITSNGIHHLRHRDAPSSTKADEESVATPTQALSHEEVLREKQAKLALWNELKITAFSRTITSLYGVVLLSLQTHVQLNLLGRYAYLTSVSSLSTQAESTANHHIRIERHDGQTAHDEDYDEEADDRELDRDLDGDGGSTSPLRDGVDVHTERLYLTLSWWFLHRGWHQLANVVQDAVHDVFDDIALKSTLTHAEFFALVRKVRRRVEYESVWAGGGGGAGASVASLDARSEWSETTNAPTAVREARRGRRRNFASVLFPPQQQEVQTLLDAGALSSSSSSLSLEEVSPTLAALLDETRDIVESDDFWRVMRLGLTRVFSVFEDALRPAFGLGPVLAAATAAAASQTSESSARPPTTALPAVPRAYDADDGDDDVGKAVRLASLFPTVARQSTAAVHSSPNEYVDALAGVNEMRAFCAVIYSAWS